MSSRIERFSKGDRFLVSPESIERELSALWSEAGEAGEIAAAGPVA